MSMGHRLLAAALAAAFALCLAAPAGAALPRDFFGVMLDGPALGDDVDLGSETRLMSSSGVRSVRVAFYWWSMQPEPGPIDFTESDRIVAEAARAGLNVLPVVLGTPGWAVGPGQPAAAPPADPQTYADFVGRLVRRYGRRGTFWATAGVPVRPVRAWQIWNEPHIELYWSAEPWAPGYVSLLRAAHDEIKGIDRRARVVAAGLTNESWANLALLYDAGGRRYFDAAALHPFSERPRDVMRIVRLARSVMRKEGDGRKPLLLTEVSWSSGEGLSTQNHGWETTEAGQAKRLRQILKRIARARRKLRIRAAFWYTWLSPPIGQAQSFDYSGLRRMDGGSPVSKPALDALRSTIRKLR